MKAHIVELIREILIVNRSIEINVLLSDLSNRNFITRSELERLRNARDNSERQSELLDIFRRKSDDNLQPFLQVLDGSDPDAANDFREAFKEVEAWDDVIASCENALEFKTVDCDKIAADWSKKRIIKYSEADNVKKARSDKKISTLLNNLQMKPHTVVETAITVFRDAGHPSAYSYLVAQLKSHPEFVLSNTPTPPLDPSGATAGAAAAGAIASGGGTTTTGATAAVAKPSDELTAKIERGRRAIKTEKARRHIEDTVEPNTLLPSLSVRGVLTDGDCERIRAEKTRDDRVQALVTILGRKQSDWWDSFMECLKRDGQAHLAVQLTDIWKSC